MELTSVVVVALFLGAGVTLALFLAGYLTSGAPSSTATIANTALAAATAAVTSASLNAALLLAAALAASVIPFIGPIIAASLFAAYVIAQAAVVFLLGRQVAAAQVASAAANDVRASLAAVAAARLDLFTRCTNVESLNSCLSMPSPCSSVP
jgi:hypothetical protein